MSLLTFKAWKDVKWTDVDTDNNGYINNDEVGKAKKNKIIIWEGMTEKQFNHEKQLRCYAEKYAIGNFIGNERCFNSDLEKEIIRYGEELEQLEKEETDSYYKGEVSESTSNYYGKQTRISSIDTKDKSFRTKRMQYLKKMVVSLATRIFGAHSMNVG